MSSDKHSLSVSRFVPVAVRGTRVYGLARRNKPEIKRFVKFAIVGGVGLVIDIALLNIFERGLGMPVPIAVALAFIIAATHNFIGNRLWVYPESRAQKKRRQMPVFLAVNAAGLLINELIFLFFQAPITELVRLIPVPAFQTHYRGIGLNATKLIAAVVVMLWNFFVNRFVTFRSVAWQQSLSTE
ncbi:MAG: GtrA family protein, partial [Thermoflexales bacterium]|nr:GtrA family protein [Thermoflexales bacterium]